MSWRSSFRGYLIDIACEVMIHINYIGDQFKVFKETTAPWSQLVDPILGQGSLHQLIHIVRPVTKSGQSVLHLVVEEGWLLEYQM